VLVVWIVRGVLLAALLPVVLPLRMLWTTFTVTPIGIALLALALALLALGVVFGLLLGVLGGVADVIILFGLIGLAWHWPRGIRAAIPVRLRLAYRGAKNALARQVRCLTLIDFAFCLVIVLIAIVLSLSSGFFQFFATILIVLIVIGVIWKWPRSPHLPFVRKLRLALRALWQDLRSRFR
jgi:hypothetical protein